MTADQPIGDVELGRNPVGDRLAGRGENITRRPFHRRAVFVGFSSRQTTESCTPGRSSLDHMARAPAASSRGKTGSEKIASSA